MDTSNHGSGRTSRFAVIDTETTGLGKSDRPCEIAVVLLDDDYRTVGEWTQRINPQRSVGSSYQIHGISDADLADEPTFAEVSSQLTRYLDGRALVAHNLEFDVRMLAQAYGDLRSARFDPGEGLCTMILSNPKRRVKLTEAAKMHGIKFPKSLQHSALGDARVCAQVLGKLAGISKPQPFAGGWFRRWLKRLGARVKPAAGGGSIVRCLPCRITL